MQYVYETKPKYFTKARRRWLVFLIVMILIASLILFYFNTYVNPVITSTSKSKIKMLTTRAINSSVTELLNSTNVYDDLIKIERNADGDVVLISADAAKINLLAKDITRVALQKIEMIGENGISIPIGSFTGMPILMGRGPEVQIKVVPIGTLDSKFVSQFVSSGINQTLHRIYLTIQSNINLVLPIFDNPVQTYTEVMLCESVIVGKIPNVYFQNGGIVENLLDLVPK